MSLNITNKDSPLRTKKFRKADMDTDSYIYYLRGVITTKPVNLTILNSTLVSPILGGTSTGYHKFMNMMSNVSAEFNMLSIPETKC